MLVIWVELQYLMVYPETPVLMQRMLSVVLRPTVSYSELMKSILFSKNS